MGRLRRIMWTNWPIPMEAESPSPETPNVVMVWLARIAPVETDGMRPCTLLKLCARLMKYAGLFDEQPMPRSLWTRSGSIPIWSMASMMRSEMALWPHPGCGHNAISERIIDAMYQMGIEPERVQRERGIGCSSKSPAYFMSRAHSFNSVHGRMPSVSTGAILANHTMTTLGVSGDGDSASIGMGQFVHMMRRNLPMIYIIEDNGVYGLTKGQFSATADLGSTLKTGVVNDLAPIDTCALAIQLGATFVGRSFSGDKKQLLSMLKAAIAHKGTVMLDVISPCVTFNDHEGSTKSYKFMQDNDEPINEVDFVASFDEIEVDYESGEIYEVEMHDGSNLRLRKLHESYDPTDKANAVRTLMESQQNEEILTGVFYIDTQKPTFIDQLNVVDEPLGQLPESLVRPPKPVLDGLMASLQ